MITKHDQWRDNKIDRLHSDFMIFLNHPYHISPPKHGEYIKHVDEDAKQKIRDEYIKRFNEETEPKLYDKPNEMTSKLDELTINQFVCFICHWFYNQLRYKGERKTNVKK